MTGGEQIVNAGHKAAAKTTDVYIARSSFVLNRFSSDAFHVDFVLWHKHPKMHLKGHFTSFQRVL